MLRKLRIVLASVFFVLVTLLFLDFTGALHGYIGWMARIQFLPAVLALNLGVVAALLALTLVFGRVYCSVICPLGVMQDVLGYFGKRRRKNRYGYSRAKSVLRYAVLALFVAALAAGVHSVVVLLAPYSSYGRIASNLFAPLYALGNNLLAYAAERADSYAFYRTDVWIRSAAGFATAAVTFAAIGVLAWRNGRTYCNTVCPVGTVLGFVSRFSLLRPVIDTEKCVDCKLCSRNCKAACIDLGTHTIDYSRCVACMDCIDVCRKGALSYTLRRNTVTAGGKAAATPSAEPSAKPSANAGVQSPAAPSDGGGKLGRAGFLAGMGMLAAEAVRSQEKKVDGGLAVIIDKKIPARATRIVPAGAESIRNMAAHCTGCQLCVSVCPNGVLRPSADPSTFLQPEMSYERGYCRPECVKCAEVCPAGAILKITEADKSSIQIGHAVWIRDNCIVIRDGEECDNCFRHCPTEAISMVSSDPSRKDAPRIPVVNTERCIGCGACENLCPSRPFSAMYVEGHRDHRII